MALCSQLEIYVQLEEGGVCSPKGFKAAGMRAKLRSTGQRPDLALFYCDTPVRVHMTTSIMLKVLY